MKESMERQLKFNPYYYRIMTPEEIEAVENDQQNQDITEFQSSSSEEEEKKDDLYHSAAAHVSDRKSMQSRGSLPRKVSQAKLTFPATLDQVKDDLLAEVDEDQDEMNLSAKGDKYCIENADEELQHSLSDEEADKQR